MRTTLQLEDSLVEHARRISGTTRITDLVRQGLEALIRQEARKRLAAFGGSDTSAWGPERERGFAVAQDKGVYSSAKQRPKT